MDAKADENVQDFETYEANELVRCTFYKIARYTVETLIKIHILSQAGKGLDSSINAIYQ